METWLDAIARATGAGVIALDGAMRPLGADARALHLLACASGDELAACLEPFQSRVRAWCHALATEEQVSGELQADGPGATTLAVRVFALGEMPGELSRYLLLLDAEPRHERTLLADFARRLGHDLRGPLNAMVLNLDLMRISIENGDESEAARSKRLRYLANMQREIDRLSEVVAAAVAQGKAGDA